MKTKLDLAHEWYLKHSESPSFMDIEVKQAWQYADAMYAEQENRNHPEIPDSSGWQPDWYEIPSNANYFAMDKCGMCNVYEREPEICEDQWDFGDAICEVNSFGYTGDWRDSLRKRPD